MPDTPTFQWGHININVTRLEASIAFYEKLGFYVFLPGIPYLGLNMNTQAPVPEDARNALGWPPGTTGRACIMQLSAGMPMIDLTELSAPERTDARKNHETGIVRLCLGSNDLSTDIGRLQEADVEIVSGPATANSELADVAIIADPDGNLIELIQVHLEHWGSYFKQAS